MQSHDQDQISDAAGELRLQSQALPNQAAADHTWLRVHLCSSAAALSFPDHKAPAQKH